MLINITNSGQYNGCTFGTDLIYPFFMKHRCACAIAFSSVLVICIFIDTHSQHHFRYMAVLPVCPAFPLHFTIEPHGPCGTVKCLVSQIYIPAVENLRWLVHSWLVGPSREARAPTPALALLSSLATAHNACSYINISNRTGAGEFHSRDGPHKSTQCKTKISSGTCIACHVCCCPCCCCCCCYWPLLPLHGSVPATYTRIPAHEHTYILLDQEHTVT